MALWTPPSNVGPNEHIGRRLFERHKLKGAQDQKPLLNGFELYHFEETRDNGDVSLDRLGQSSIDRRVRTYVEKRAAAAALKFHPIRPFTGWATIRAKELQKPEKGPCLPVIASPKVNTDGDELSENKYHAHVERPINYGAYEMALHLKNIFERKPQFEAASLQSSQGAARVPAPMRLWEWVCKIFWRKP